MKSPTLALEQLMTHPRYAQLVEQIRATVPTGALDQADAATRDATTVLEHMGKLLRTPVEGVAPAQIAGWLRLSAIEAVVTFLSGRADTCMHNPHPMSPEPVITAAWRPGLVTCTRCAHLFRLHGDADRTCDGCGRVCEGGIHPAAVQLGPLVFQFGACSDCGPSEA